MQKGMSKKFGIPFLQESVEIIRIKVVINEYKTKIKGEFTMLISIDHGYGNMLCKGIFNPEDF